MPIEVKIDFRDMDVALTIGHLLACQMMATYLLGAPALFDKRIKAGALREPFVVLWERERSEEGR